MALRARSADGLPAQAELALLLVEAVELLRPVEAEILGRAGSAPASWLADLQLGSGHATGPTTPASGSDGKPQEVTLGHQSGTSAGRTPGGDADGDLEPSTYSSVTTVMTGQSSNNSTRS